MTLHNEVSHHTVISERGYSKRVRELPTAFVYVTMYDSFMAGWGPALQCKNHHAILCTSWIEAGLIAERAMTRPEMSRVSVSADRPIQKPHTLYSWSGPDGWK